MILKLAIVALAALALGCTKEPASEKSSDLTRPMTFDEGVKWGLKTHLIHTGIETAIPMASNACYVFDRMKLPPEAIWLPWDKIQEIARWMESTNRGVYETYGTSTSQ